MTTTKKEIRESVVDTLGQKVVDVLVKDFVLRDISYKAYTTSQVMSLCGEPESWKTRTKQYKLYTEALNKAADLGFLEKRQGSGTANKYAPIETEDLKKKIENRRAEKEAKRARFIDLVDRARGKLRVGPTDIRAKDKGDGVYIDRPVFIKIAKKLGLSTKGL